MGGYQDKCTAIALMESYWLKHIDHGINKPFMLIMDEWNNEKGATKILLVQKLKADPVLTKGEAGDIPITLDTGL